MTETYKLEFKCTNCGNSFSEQIEKGKKVEDRKQKMSNPSKKVVVLPEGKTKLSDIREITCPNCGTQEKVRPVR